jgi:DeoR/GlpR family transcriptional regulator of sugar metabolism
LWSIIVDYEERVRSLDQNGSERAIVPAHRREWIASRLLADGSITVQAVEAEFGVSPMTARRDLGILEREGRALRTHGGAVAPTLARHEDSFAARLEQASGAKQRLAAAAALLVDDGEAVFVDSSTTAYTAVRDLLAAGRRMTILTNSLPVMDLVAQNDLGNVDLIGLAGTLRKATRSFVGPQTVEAIERHFADKLLFSVNGLAPGGVLTDADPLEAEVKRAMVGQARESILLLDGSKFGRAGLSVITDVKRVATVLVADASPEQMHPLARSGVRVEEAR